MSKDINHNMEPAFTRALYFENTQVPDYLINNYQAIGLSDQQFIDLLRVLACQQKFSAYVEQDRSEEHTSELQLPVPISSAVFCL